ncbi:MAG TPA: cobalamin biosynthesis protein CobD [Deltaproteobacteria bacterium]|nr:cobalamin biosynthesis protein CobD [Deltaproteobacteria bacterium]
MSYFPVIFVSAILLDLAVGDPRKLPHPVRCMGGLVTFLEEQLLKPHMDPVAERKAGQFLVIATVGVVFVVSALALYIAWRVHPFAYFLVAVYMGWSAISIRSLDEEATAVIDALEKEGIEEARLRLAGIVGRDTEGLSAEEIRKAVVETVSENTSDGVVAPLFYLALGGPVLALVYKAVSTLDSMVGYRNARYVNFGRAAAILDDWANFIPARITAWLMVFSSLVLGGDWRKAAETVRRDALDSPSPNAGYPQAAVAGALGVRLGGPSSYGGETVEKPFIGDGARAVDDEAVASSVKIMYVTALVMALASLIVRSILF